LAKGAIAMQIAPTIILIDTRFDILLFSNLKRRSQEKLDRVARGLSAMPMATFEPAVGHKPAAAGRIQLCQTG
jgi:hypothetical protein